MRVEFDPAKDRANRVTHGVALAFAEKLDWDAALVWVDDRFQYEELRMIALAPEVATLYYVAFVESGNARRIISLRREVALQICTQR